AGRLFVDVKLHDIPNTVAGAARALAQRGAWLLTVHVAGGRAMCEAALAAAAEGAAQAGVPRPLVVGVTVLTSLDEAALGDELGHARPVADEVLRRAELAVRWGLDGVVCSPREAARVRAVIGPDRLLITPGIRPAGAASGDQARVATPAAAVRAGADYLVVGRPVHAAADPYAALLAIAREVEQAHD
ncbi:MAG TPA: orotidine-5'-phosphate decarboxylase, partial [Bacillota bacterium]